MAFGTIFQPDDLDDIADFKLGERYKVSLNSVSVVDSTTTKYRTQTAVSTADYHKNTEVALSKTSDSKDDEYLYVVGYGDITVPHNQLDATAAFVETKGYITLTGCVHFASKCISDNDGVAVKKGGPKHASPYSGIQDLDGSTAGQTKFPFGSQFDTESVDRAKLAKSTVYNLDGSEDITICNEVVVKDRQFDFHGGADQSRFVWNSCVMDQIPDDSKFYIGMSFETHDEHSSLISGTDLTNTVPLHLNLKFNMSDSNQEKVSQGDIITSFIHYDCILRLEPDGNVVTSQ